MIDLIPELPGVNCSNGGYKIVSGVDANNNNLLDASEISVTKYICNGANASKFLISIVPQAAGSDCATGGYKISSGIDNNNNNILDPAEVMNSQFLCNGLNGNNGLKSLLDLIPEPAGNNCPSGGYKVVSGVDINNNNILEPTEIQITKYVCNGSNGNNSLVAFVPEPAGTNCATGGYKLNSGLDLNNNGTLDAGEIRDSKFVCNGATGKNSLLTLTAEAAGANCGNGGYKISNGVDLNNNASLESSEVQNTFFICNGKNGSSYLLSIIAEAPGSNCNYGGYRFNTGLDLNGNGVLETAEITNMQYMCSNSPINELRIPIDFPTNTTSVVGAEGLGISQFNKSNYPGMDSIVFAGRVYSGSLANTAIAELYDFDNNTLIANSQISSNQGLGGIIYSSNLNASLPATTINIGLRVRSQVNGQFSGIYGTSYLILYKK